MAIKSLIDWIKRKINMNMPEDIKVATREVIVPFTSTSVDDLVGSIVTFFNVDPKRNGDNWITDIVNTATGEKSPTPPLYFYFEPIPPESKAPKDLELYQKLVLIIDLQQSKNELWQFYGDGIVFIDQPLASQLNVQTEIKNQGKRLVLTIDKVAEGLDNIDLKMRYVASRINLTKGAGKLKVYYSQDPSISVGRRKED